MGDFAASSELAFGAEGGGWEESEGEWREWPPQESFHRVSYNVWPCEFLFFLRRIFHGWKESIGSGRWEVRWLGPVEFAPLIRVRTMPSLPLDSFFCGFLWRKWTMTFRSFGWTRSFGSLQ